MISLDWPDCKRFDVDSIFGNFEGNGSDFEEIGVWSVWGFNSGEGPESSEFWSLFDGDKGGVAGRLSSSIGSSLHVLKT